ncbi:uncharacterized protein LOC135849471 [Planococcus citri]|uniref:uncharacterized protein LOC135849471 n=1 Tax=Planococcus citri TaxID=170843 RepID=UPI0031F801B0
MDRTNPTFSFVSDSEDSDSSSSSEKERKKAYLLKQSVVETVKPSTISIEETKLTSLVNIIEAIMVLNNAGIKSPSFDENAQLKIQHFLTTYAQESLFAFFIENTIHVDFIVPKECAKNTMYFIKLINEEKENLSLEFSNLIIFGKIDQQAQATLISTLKMVFISSIYNMKSIPYRIKRRITKTLEEFLLELTETYFRHFGISEIYLPALSFFEVTEINDYIRTDDIISLFESIVVRWCRVINDAIYDNEIDFHVVKDFSILTLINFWEYKLNNLNLLSKCLKDENVIKLCEILQTHNSVHLNFLFKLQTELEDQAKESETIIENLRSLKQIHENMNSLMIENILMFLPKIFSTINMVLSRSTYFQSSENTKLLLMSFSQQIINICRQKISIANILLGETTESMKNVMESLKTCCLLNQMLKCEILEISDWNKISQAICNSIEAFMQRCNDLLDLCSTINLFTCSQNHGYPIHISFEQHIEVKENLRDISECFSTNLNNFKRIEYKVLYVQCSDWYTAADSFQDKMQEIDNKIIKFAEKSFDYVTTTEDELNVLRMLYHYSKLHSLKSLFVEKYDQLANHILKEIQELKNSIIFQTIKPLIGNWICLDIVTCTFLKKRRLQFLSKLVSDCSWISNNKLIQMKLNFEESIFTADKFIVHNYKEWLEVLSATILNLTKRPLVTKCFYKPGLLEVNIDRKLLKIIKDSKSWIQIGLKLPADLDKLFNAFAQILILYGDVEDLVMSYNRIISSLSSGEYILFLEIIDLCSEHISPTLYSMQWDYDQSSDTVLNYLKQVKHVENSIKNYKHYNKQIIEACKSICSINFLRITKMNLEDIKQEIYATRLICLKKIINHYNTIASTIQTLFNNFGHHIFKMKEIWNLFVEKIDSLLECALLCCVMNSLRSLLHNFNATSDLDDDSLVKIKIFVAIENRKIKFKPDLNDILTFFAHVDTIVLEGITVIPRLYNKLKLSKSNNKISYAKQFSTNENISLLQEQIMMVSSENLSHVKEHIQTWYPYRTLWKIDAEYYALEYCKICSSAEDYGRDFLRYSQEIKKMENSSFNQRIFLFIVDTEILCDGIITLCRSRLSNLSNVLRKSVFSSLNDIFSYIEESNRKLNLELTETEYLIFVKKLVSEMADKENDIQRIRDYVNTLSQFKFQDLEKKQEEAQKKWQIYKNTLERNRLKIKMMYNTII